MAGLTAFESKLEFKVYIADIVSTWHAKQQCSYVHAAQQLLPDHALPIHQTQPCSESIPCTELCLLWVWCNANALAYCFAMV